MISIMTMTDVLDQVDPPAMPPGAMGSDVCVGLLLLLNQHPQGVTFASLVNLSAALNGATRASVLQAVLGLQRRGRIHCDTKGPNARWHVVPPKQATTPITTP